MAALGSQSIASSYEQILQVDRDGGGNGTTHVSVKDGDNGTTFGFTIASDALMMSSTNRLEFGDTGTYIHQSADGVLDLVSDTEIEINATTIDMNGAVDISSTLAVGDAVTINTSNSEQLMLKGATSPYLRFYESSGGSNTAKAYIQWHSDGYLNLENSEASTNLVVGANGVGIGDTTNANVTQGLTINMGANDDQILAFKSSDVAHGRTSYAETDSYASFSKSSATGGGLNIASIMENAAVNKSFEILAAGGTASTSAAHNEEGLVVIRVEEHDGSNGLDNVTSGGNVFSVRAQVGGATRTAFNVTEAGAISYDGSDAGAFDYAEMFEWKDGNPDNEERHGYSVVLDGDKIRKAEDGETPIGIVSVRPAICGDNPNGWYKTFKMDEWGRNIDKEVKAVKFEVQHELEPATYYEEGDELPEGKKVGDEKTAAVYTTKEKHYRGDAIPDDLPDDAEHYTILQRQYSDEYDDSQSYTMRNKRKEWSPVGLMGKLRMHKGQPTASSWIKMKDEGNDIEMWLVK